MCCKKLCFMLATIVQITAAYNFICVRRHDYTANNLGRQSSQIRYDSSVVGRSKKLMMGESRLDERVDNCYLIQPHNCPSMIVMVSLVYFTVLTLVMGLIAGPLLEIRKLRMEERNRRNRRRRFVISHSQFNRVEAEYEYFYVALANNYPFRQPLGKKKRV
ncbi:uncharacterized protein LOC142344886 [Convolutriloba macropyga]|uniref:uncharacterized protein LOC142344886 n=1 Tax=Convolutriloba macropyga TaxID=536237 RepID=UPI003F525385